MYEILAQLDGQTLAGVSVKALPLSDSVKVYESNGKQLTAILPDLGLPYVTLLISVITHSLCILLSGRTISRRSCTYMARSSCS